MSRNQHERIADLMASQARERTLYALEVQAAVEAMQERHAKARADLARELGISALEQPIPGSTGAAARPVTTRAADQVVTNGKGRRQ